jgi:hypothetical protein
LSEAYTNSVALAADGSIYVSGWYSYHAGETTDSMKFGGSVTLPGAVSNTGTPFLAKLTAAGSVQWVANAGVTYASMTAAKVVVLPSGDPVLVDPVFGGATGTPETISFAPAGSVVRANTNDHFVVLAKADKTTGAWQWVTRSGSSGAADNIYQLSAAADSSGNIYISAVYTGSGLTFGGAALPTPATTQLMVAKADSSGTWQWGSSASGTTGTLRPFGTTALADGNVVVAGEFDGTATFPGAPSTITETSSSQGAFVAKINSSGVWQWAASGGAATDNEAYATAQLPSGSLAVVGFVRGTAPAMFGSVGVTTGDPGSRDIFVGRISLAGAWEAPSLSIPSTLVTVTVTDTSGSAPAPVTITSS